MNEIAKLRELLKAKEKRLYELQLKEAQKGYDTPIDILTEMEKIKEEIHKLGSQISSYAGSSTTSNDIPKVVCDTVEQLKRLGIGGKVIVYVFEFHVGPTGS